MTWGRPSSAGSISAGSFREVRGPEFADPVIWLPRAELLFRHGSFKAFVPVQNQRFLAELKDLRMLLVLENRLDW